MDSRLDWEDLHTVLAVADCGSLAGAARRLGVNHTTVLRRVGGFEQRLGLRLFDRLPRGYALTARGEGMGGAAPRLGAAGRWGRPPAAWRRRSRPWSGGWPARICGWTAPCGSPPPTR